MALPRPRKDSLELLNEVLEERKAGRNSRFFEGIADEWEDRVRAYIDSVGSPALVADWPEIDTHRTKFLNLYSGARDGSAQKSVLVEMRREHGLSLCPSCGEAGTPNTLDHYLPKDGFPHFSVTPLNLFPMCDACQLAKGTKTGDDDEPKFFLHPYFDVFVAERVLELSIEPPFESPNFQLGIRPGLAPDEEALVASHVRELDIAARYNKFLKGQHSRMLKLANQIRESGQDLRGSLETFAAMSGFVAENAWEHVYYRAVLDCDECIEFMRARD